MSFGTATMNHPPKPRLRGTLRISIPAKTGPRAATAEEISRLAAQPAPRQMAPGRFDMGRNDLDLIRVWTDIEGNPVALRKDAIGWLCTGGGPLAGKTILGARNSAEEAIVINAPLRELEAWWTWQRKHRRRWRLAGDEQRSVVVRLEMVSKLRPAGDEGTWLFFRNKGAKPVLVAAPFDEMHAWWASYPKAKEDRR